MPAYIVLFGPPGAGKGTQAKEISKQLHIPQISTGDLFRAMRTQDTPLAKRVREIMAGGGLVPDDVTVQMVEERLAEPDCKDGALMDGFPRTVPQADAFNDLLARNFNSKVALVPLMNISEDEAVRRISGRRSCPTCGKIYHVDFNPPRNDEQCDDDSTPLVQREDDRAEVVRERYRVYLQDTAPLVDYYRQRGLLAEIDATRPIKDINAELLALIRKYV